MEGVETNAFGGALRLSRQKRGVSLRSVVARAGISYATLSYWETGKTQPRLPELERVLIVLGVSAEERRSLLALLESTRSLRNLHLAEGTALPPLSGDLLWSMRLRRGATQAGAARAVGVHQTQIARWERGDAWPDAGKLHALCWHLGATPEELSALTSGNPTETPTGAYSDAIAAMPFEENAAGVARGGASSLDLEQWNGYMTEFLFGLQNPHRPLGALLDLTLLTIENRLNRRAEHDTAAATLLPVAYGVHARLHLDYQQFPQAAFYAERGLASARRLRDADSVRFATLDHSFWFSSVIAAGDAAAMTNVRARHLHAVKTLGEWLPLVAQSGSTHKGWGLSTLATLLHKLGRNEEALAVSRQSCRQELSPAPHYADHLYRLFAQAELLMQMGRPHQALDTLEKCRKLDPLVGSFYHSQRHKLQEQCLMRLQQS